MTPPVERRSKDPWRLQVEEQLVVMQQNLDANTKLTEETKQKVDAVHDVVTSIQGAFKTFSWIATGAKYVSMFVVSVLAIFYAWKSGDVSKVDIPK